MIAPRHAERTWTRFRDSGHLGVTSPSATPPTSRTPRRIAGTSCDLVDRTCSRFREDSDLCEVNRHPGELGRRWTLCWSPRSRSPSTRPCTPTGWSTRCLGGPLVALGYDRDSLRSRAPRRPHVRRAAARSRRPAGLARDPARPRAGAATDPRGDCALDLGATGKAWAADLVAATVAEQLGCRTRWSASAATSASTAPDRPPWPVRVDRAPRATPTRSWSLLAGGGLATSSTRARRWRTGDADQHHLLDPRTGRAGRRQAWRTVTATGPTCVAANVATTAALVLAATRPGWLDGASVDRPARRDRRRRSPRTGDWPPTRTPTRKDTR